MHEPQDEMRFRYAIMSGYVARTLKKDVKVFDA
jgi:hypothetical protein